jgi:hypothetical protein
LLAVNRRNANEEAVGFANLYGGKCLVDRRDGKSWKRCTSAQSLIQTKDKDAAKVIVDRALPVHARRLARPNVRRNWRARSNYGALAAIEPMNSYERRIVHNAFKDDPDVATWSPSDSARIKQITLLKRQAKKEPAAQQ